LPVTEQDYRNIVARMRVDPIFKSFVIQLIRDNLDSITYPLMKEVDRKIEQAIQDKKRYY
jgi:hypothetical protein